MIETIDGQQSSNAEIVFHFDVAEHSIPLRQFIDTANSAKSILDDLDEQIFDRKLNYQLRVAAPESGGLVETLMLVLGAPGAVFGILHTDMGKAFFKGLFEQEPAEWAEQFGQSLRERFLRRFSPEQEEQSLPVAQDDALTLIEAKLLAELVTRFYLADLAELRTIGISLERFRKAFVGRNQFFKACIDNKEVQGVAFDRSHEFPLKRADFTRQIAQLPDPVDKEEEATAWAVETVDIIVNSPNWKRDGRKWQASTSSHKDIAFSIEDETFWHHVDIKDIQPDIRDNMRVQWAYPAGLSKPAQVRVLRVVSYNGTPISDPVNEASLQDQLGEAQIIEPDEPSLFDQDYQNNSTHDDGGES